MQERRHPQAILPLFLFKNRAFVHANLLIVFSSAGMFGAIQYLPTFIQTALGASATASGLVSTPPAEQPGTKSDLHPGVALALGFIPGLGAVYNGEYIKALIHVFVFGGLIAAQTSNVPGGYHAFLGIALGCFYFYMPIEAYRTAKAREREKLLATATGAPVGTEPAGTDLGAAVQRPAPVGCRLRLPPALTGLGGRASVAPGGFAR